MPNREIMLSKAVMPGINRDSTPNRMRKISPLSRIDLYPAKLRLVKWP